MNKQVLSELTDKCHECIEAWKKENWHKPLDIELGDFIEHCRMYGGGSIQELYEHVWDDAEDDDPEVQKALWKLERHLFMLNLDDDLEEETMSEEQKERIYIGKRIAMLREEHDMTQQELAAKIGVKRDHISRIEAGKYSISLDILSKIAKAFDTNIDFL